MHKSVLFLLSSLMIFSILFSVPKTEAISYFEENPKYHSWTKAICDYEDRLCYDAYIECEGDKIINITPLTRIMYMGREWTDPRSEEQINKWC